ncbi:uncharacterized protein LOC131669358 isoform X2 [Phymastichus coffea]|nr:uncharacterized protein LOC131669358 isoform X2 [Phymastichus coffea]XP_058800166.1 uncharacterized protein LOC131669358 isoform X2 [Phymastichus coffea]XP_058800168.1 uncharacterized protein LOC131669358 isoform X2 [Phymastichus coffea]
MNGKQGTTVKPAPTDPGSANGDAKSDSIEQSIEMGIACCKWTIKPNTVKIAAGENKVLMSPTLPIENKGGITLWRIKLGLNNLSDKTPQLLHQIHITVVNVDNHDVRCRYRVRIFDGKNALWYDGIDKNQTFDDIKERKEVLSSTEAYDLSAITVLLSVYSDE